jgi:hypothetical protein
MAISPEYYREARLTARDHIQGYILKRMGHRARILIVRVFRGPLWPGQVVEITLNFGSDHPTPGDPLASDWQAYEQRNFCEAFLDGDPPRLVWEQIKFLKHPTWRPSGDITRFSYGW